MPTAEFAVGALGLTVLAGSFGTGAALAVRKTFGSEGIFIPTLGMALAYVRNDLTQPTPTAKAGLAGLAATLCPVRLTASILTIEPCALLVGGWLSATSRDANHKSSVDRLWVSAGATLRVAAYLAGGVSLELEAGISAILIKRRFYITEPKNLVAETPTLSPLVGLALSYGL